MKIVRADTHWIAVPFEHGGPKTTGFGGRPWANMQTLIVEIETDNGLVGHGEILDTMAFQLRSPHSSIR